MDDLASPRLTWICPPPPPKPRPWLWITLPRLDQPAATAKAEGVAVHDLASPVVIAEAKAVAVLTWICPPAPWTTSHRLVRPSPPSSSPSPSR
ncbi:hypothetical protein E2562_003256 [Oryza meyeriana var. granulata]|uniref:Uncharacterized protein n=1 Tax=Oryza meyeriana var. granulata TaxID=110450 RepID=A0A6G1EUY6_9ORYZ|nr:hypothetical protein E2562_003256 [Oryza meyeriana var. granulata]